jgi:NAD+ kinase
MPSVSRAAVVVHGRPESVAEPLERVRGLAADLGVELVEGNDVDLAIVLGGDGTMLRALKRFLGTGVPVLGVNYGRVGFLTSIKQEELEGGLRRAFEGEFVTFELPTLDAEVGGSSNAAVNDVVVASASLGRMIELEWAIGGEDLGSVPCDGMICSTPSGSTAYNLSNGGPVLVWGLDAMAVTFVAPHSLHARPLVVPRSNELSVTHRTSGVDTAVLADGHEIGRLGAGETVSIRLADSRSLLAALPESTFFRRYRETFAS